MKKNEAFIEKYKGQDGIVGRPTRLNQATLKINGRGYAPLLFLGDIHFGYPTCNIIKAQSMIDWAINNHAYVVLMGDLLECGLTGSIGDSVYQQLLNPQAQMEQMIEMLTPLADTGRVIGLHEGNHEERITKNTSLDVSKIMARILGVPYLGYCCWSLLKVGKINYTLYSSHGTSGSILEHTKLNAVIKMSNIVRADIVAYGHTHGLAAHTQITQYVDLRSKMVKDAKTYCVLTGAFLGWDRSYGQKKGYGIPKIGSPKAKLRADKKDVHFSL
ncbi:MAG: metallophosphoesterase [Parcubacteria group bacterium]|nr:metallophosphoesterase [Parcubacteria group bacterium]